jgi:hypothetical protein
MSSKSETPKENSMTAIKFQHPVGTCAATGKRRYQTCGDARRALFNTRVRGRTEQAYYVCKLCDGGLHLTKQDQYRETPDSRWSAKLTEVVDLVLTRPVDKRDALVAKLASQIEQATLGLT